tara:strand:- start:32 stop:1288 length:1257 start_codon:yes stop_codon:yes gene_type:complete
MNDLPTIADQIWLIEPCAGSALVAQGRIARTPQQQTPLTSVDEGIAKVAIRGVIGTSMTADTNTEMLIAAINEYADDDGVTSILLAVDSPGGQASQVDKLSQAVRAASAQKPVYAQINRMGASAAMFAVAHATKIFAQAESDMVGSIGTMINLVDSSKAFAQAGLETVAITTGSYKALGAAGTEITEEHRQHLQSLVDGLQENFTLAISEGRDLTGAELAQVTDGRIFLASQALQHGLIDAIQDVTVTLDSLSAITNRKGLTMANETQVAELADHASMRDLKKLPGVTNDFVVQCLEDELTIEEATAKWMSQLVDAKASADEAAATASQAADEARQDADAKAALAADASLADGSTEASEESSDPIASWNSAIAQVAKDFGLSRHDAAQKVGQENEELRYSYINAYREKFGVASDNRKS